MRISYLRVQNYRLFRDLTIVPYRSGEGDPDLVVLIGENNVGKTTLLSLLDAILNPNRSLRTIPLDASDFADPDKPILIDLHFAELTDQEISHFYTVLDFSSQETFLPIRFQAKFNSETQEIDVALFFPRDVDNRRLQYADRQHLRFLLQPALRDNRSLVPRRNTFFGQLVASLDLSQEEAQIRDLLKQIAAIIQSNPQIASFTNGLANLVKRVIRAPNTADDFVRLTAGLTQDIKKNIQLEVNHDGKHYVSVDDIGLGLQSVLSVAIFRTAVEAGLVPPAILAIDEPEAHLHPHAQRLMFAELLDLARTTQVWVATHGLSFVERIDPRCLVYLRRSNGTTTAHQLRDIDNRTVERAQNHLIGSRGEALFSRCTILVEGQTELGAYPVFSTNLDPEGRRYDFDRQGITVIHAEGITNMKGIARVLRSFDIPVLAVCDNDSSVSSTFDRELKELRKIASEVWVVDSSCRDFEGVVASSANLERLLSVLSSILDEAEQHRFMTSLIGLYQELGDTSTANQIINLQRSGRGLNDVVTVIHTKDAEARLRHAAAQQLRRKKGYSTGRIIAGFLKEDIPPFIREVICKAAELAEGGRH